MKQIRKNGKTVTINIINGVYHVTKTTAVSSSTIKTLTKSSAEYYFNELKKDVLHDI